MNPYGHHFMARRARRHRHWQAACGRVLARHFGCQSVVDLGCGIGSWLEGFRQAGVEVVRGYEFALASATPYLEPGLAPCICVGDLSTILPLERRYDLALCIEVLEHIPEEHAATAIQNLVAASDCLLFSAASPGQRGTGHVNCQPKEYWLKLFATFGYEHCPTESDRVITLLREAGAADWVVRNGMVIRKVGGFQSHTSPAASCR